VLYAASVVEITSFSSREREERKLGQKKCFLFDDAFGWLVGPGEFELVVSTFPSVSKFPMLIAARHHHQRRIQQMKMTNNEWNCVDFY
jgi:hypothetical protein